ALAHHTAPRHASPLLIFGYVISYCQHVLGYREKQKSPEELQWSKRTMEVKRITLIVTLWLHINLILQHASAFNLDDTNVLRKNGEAGSLFGFSLAMHHQLKPNDQQVLLIGAPHANALPSQKANITGGLYRCKFTTQSNDCERIAVDTEDSKPGQGLDHRENQWMGVHVKSQGPGGKVVVCAHRYQQWIHSNQLVLGRCFILEQNLIVEDTRTFCRNRPSAKDLFGYCQQGVSAAFTKDKNYIVFSGPGAYDWKGTVRVEPIDNFLLDSYETGDQNEFSESRIPLTLSSYLGFALDSGMNLLKKSEQVIVAGAPRSNLSGEVLILKPESVEAQRSLSVAHILHGPGLASSFGYSLAVTDLNADGWDDLVVGAPQYCSTDMEAGIGGAVYVYINRRDGRDWDWLQPDILTGNKDSMFGLAVANTGDINQDGYNDFAVGAPYDNDGDGAVYLYFGKTGHFSQKGYQVLEGKGHQIKLFGYSLAGNMDIDGNGYPDLAVGSLSDSVLIYRAKPVISMEKSLTLTPTEMNFQERDCQKGHCIITAESCFSFTTYPATYNPRLQILYKLNVDEQWVQKGHQSRLVFQNNQEGNMFQTQGQKRCVQSRLRLRANTEDRLTEIPISVSVSLPQTSPPQTLKQSSLPALQPALSDLQPQESTAKFKFLNPGCGSDNICQSNLQLQYSFCTKDQHQDSCSPLARENGVPVISPGSENTALEITVTNPRGDDAHLAQLVANFPESLPLSSVILKPDSKVDVQCDVDGTKTRAECNLGNPFKRDAEVTFYLLLNSDRLTPSITDVNVTLNLQTISMQNISEIVADAQVFFELYLQVFGLAKPSQVYFREMKKNKSDEVIGEPVQYEFTISNMGRPLKSFASATLNIQWPKENKDGKWLLYLLQITGPNNQSIPCSPASEISPLKHAEEVMFRGKRQAENEAKASAFSTEGLLSLFGSKRHYKYLTCDDELKCVELRCPLKASDRTAVTLHSRLWSSTFVEEYSSLNYLDIVLNASLSLDGSQKNIRLRESQTQVRLTVFPEKKPTFLSRVPWWVGLLSVVLALLLLSLLIYFLSKGDSGSLMERAAVHIDELILLIGAPRAKALPSQKANITGGLYRCKFTTQSNDCERIAVDTEDSMPGQGLDHRENQWMGVHVKSQGPGGKVVVCAHRYQQWIHSNQLVLGRCFILEQNLIVDDTRMFCRNRGRSKDLFGYCQQGVSAAFTKDKNYIVFSGPGAYDWKGIVRMEPIEDLFLDYYETKEQILFNGNFLPLIISSYLGFALDSGMNLLKKSEQVIVAGAPRSNLSGEVLILKPDSVEAQRSLSVAHILHGPGLASSFGYSLAVTDLNADGWDDLVVGAPQYSSVDMEAGIGGAVYVYINRRDGRDWDWLQPDILTGNKDSMFGLAVANTGDINQDGYNGSHQKMHQDTYFAVGAPYDNDGDGAVYLYFGKTGHFSQKDNQVLQGKGHQIKLFGYSLAGNMDIDGNGYPDLAVGSLSDSVFVYRAKPVISMEKSLTLTPSEMDFQERECHEGRCIVIAKSCFSYTTYPATYNPRLQILYKLNADERWVQEGHQSRLVFQNNHEGNIELQTQGQKRCADTEDKLTEIPISVSVSLSQYSPPPTLRQSSLPALQPVLNDLQPRESTAKFMFLNPGCGSDNICQSNLQLQYSFCTKDQHQDSCSPLAREDGVAVISPGSGNTALEITVTNPGGDDAHLTQLVANFPESLSLSSVILKPDSKVDVQCDVDGTKTRAECNLGNPFKRDAEVTFYLLLNSDRLTPSITDVNVTLNLQTISAQNISETVAEARVFFELYLQVFGLAKPSQVNYREEKSESEEQIGEPVQYEFMISNMGRPLKSFASVTLNIQWPKENIEGKWLLYLLQITGPNNQSIPCSPASEISPLKHAQEEYSSLKYLDIILNASLSLDGSQKNVRLRRSQTQVRLTVFPERKPTFLSRVPWWVILLSVVLALLLLSLLIYFLSKLGFLDCTICTEVKGYHAINQYHTSK
ncbi:hypothetical protein QTP70_018437, partial [Hemibagrus guttatus]